MTEKNNLTQKFVTYKWLFATAVSILATLILLLSLFQGNVKSALNEKVDYKIFEERTGNISNYIKEMNEILKETQNKLQEIDLKLTRIDTNVKKSKER